MSQICTSKTLWLQHMLLIRQNRSIFSITSVPDNSGDAFQPFSFSFSFFSYRFQFKL
uniref:Uncharacterized protein MANES_06G035600 n=1 Tax=Rhizophora mucronata TaxID=61149 RepID=A0A2P2JYX2_RHIMU